MREMMKSEQRVPAPRFTDYIWLNVRSSVILSWVMVVAAFVVVYCGGLVILKGRQLRASLDIATETVRESLIQASDWPLALGHLQSLERSGHAFEITLRDKTQGSNLAGPFGSRPFGVGRLCAREDVGGKFILSGCMRVLELPEVYTLAFFVVCSLLVFLAALKFSQLKMLWFIRKVSDELDKISALDAGKQDESPVASFGIREVDAIRARIVELLNAIEKSSAAQAFADLSIQVAHDIRSPLAALEAASEDIARLPKERQVLVRGAIGRIQDIANDLLSRHRADPPPTQAVSEQLLSDLISPIVTEKRLQFRSLTNIQIKADLDAGADRLSTLIPPADLQRVLSNLINNAVEALEERSGVVLVSLSARPGWAIISVQDNGKGIPPEVLSKLGERGTSHNKPGGSGLGLHHARMSAESWGGRLELISELGKGTTAALHLPQACADDWDAILIDDDPLVRRTWEIAAVRIGKKVRTFPAESEFLKEVANLARETPVYVDAQLDAGIRGEDVSRRIHALGFRQIYLATGYESSTLGELAHLRGVVGKDPPWVA